MAGKFWFGKRNISGKSSGSDTGDSAADGAAVVMTDPVFPIGFREEDDDFPVKASDLVLDAVKRDVEFERKNVAKKGSENDQEAKNKEEPVKISDNRGGATFKTVSIPGVVDGGMPGGKPVMTPVRMAVSNAPVKLKSLSETQKNLEKAKFSIQNKPTTSALKVVNKEHSSEQRKEDYPRFGLHVRKNNEPVNTGTASNSLTPSAPAAPADYVKPMSDQRVLYYQLMNGLYDAILVLDDHGHVVDCNDRVHKVLGYSREDSWDLPIANIIKGMSSQMFAHLKKNLEENHNVLITARCFKSNGDSFKGEIGVSTVSLTRADNVVFAIRNVDQRKSIMAELRKAAAAFDISLASTFACNPEGFFTNVNKTLMESFGIPDVQQAMKVRFIDILPDAVRSFSRALNGEDIREKLIVTDADGQTVKIEIVLVPMKNGTEVTGVAGSMLPM